MSPDKLLPAAPHLAHLKDQADKLCRAFLANDPAAVARVHAVDRLGSLPGGADLALAHAQLVVAREYGFASWALLKGHVESLAATRREAQEHPMTTTPDLRRDLFNFTLGLATLQRSGVPILEGLEVASQSVRDPGLRAAILDVRGSLRDGQSLAAEFKRHARYFDPMFVQMIGVGQETGKVDVILERMAAHIEHGDSPNPLLTFVRRLSAMMEVGMPVRQALGIAAEIETDATFKAVLPVVAAAVEGGANLAEALAAHPAVFDPFIVSMVKAGDLGGVLDINLQRIAEQIERSEAFGRASG